MKSSLCLPFLLVATLCGAQLYCQTSVLEENFSSGVPPTGWVHHRVNGYPSQGWIADFFGRAWHEDESGPTTEDRLESPSFSLAGMPMAFLHFDGQTNYATYLANNPAGYGDGISSFQLSTNGGLTWNTVWTDTSLANGSYGPSINLSAYLGQTNVQVGIYFYGTYAQEWWVDNVHVDDSSVAIVDTFTNPANQHPYYLLGESDWAGAQAVAQSLGGALVSISDLAENTWIRNQTNNRDLWIGINDKESEGTFEWVSGEPVLYTNWALGQGGTNASEDFGLLDGNSGQWYDFGSGRTAFALVEISAPVLAYPILAGGTLTTISIAGLKTGARVVFVFSLNGAGPSNTPYGILDVDLDIISPLFYSINNRFGFTTLIPNALSGSTLYGQAVALNLDHSSDISNAVAQPIL
jgi:hypothetical protein